MAKCAKLQYLEGIRGLAALWVYLLHSSTYLFGEANNRWLLFYQHATLAVPLFFILSGRVLTLSSLTRLDIKSLASSAIRRPFRLVLPVIGVMYFGNLLFQLGLVDKKFANLYNGSDWMTILGPFLYIVYS